MKQLLLLPLIFIALKSYQDVAAGKPMIKPLEDEILIQEGSQLKIECYSNGEPLQFSFPEYTFMSPRSNHTISTDDNGTSTFLRPNAVSLDTGWYACALEGIEIENDYKNLNHTHEDIAWIYVYVNSSEPFSDRYYNFPKPVIALIDSPAVVPCRPTSPSLNVELRRDSEIVQLDDEIQFDPRIGFVLKKPALKNLKTYFQCLINGVKDQYYLYYSKARGQKPRMKPNVKELFLRDGDELRIECYGKTKLQFSFPNIKSDDDWLLGPITTSYEILHDDNGKSTFLRHETIPHDAGWYGCAEEGIDMNFPYFYHIDYTGRDISWIFVYVESRYEELLNQPNTRYSISPNYEEDEIIPCRYTIPNIEPNFSFSYGEELPVNIRYDAKYGFAIKRNANSSRSCLHCSGQIQDRIFSPTCYLPLFDQQMDAFQKSTKLMLLTGEDLQLQFKVFSRIKIAERWTVPVTVSINRIEYALFENSAGEEVYSRLTLKKVTERDGGEYACLIDTSTNKRIQVLILDRENTDYYMLNLQKFVYKFVRRPNENVKWLLDLGSFPSRKIQWIGPSNQLIESTVVSDLSKRVFHLTYRQRNLLSISNLTFDDSGVYQMQIETGVGVIIFNFTLDVQASPDVTFENGAQPYYVSPDVNFRTRCCAVASPRPNVTWSFSKYPNYPFDQDSVFIDSLDEKSVLIDKTTTCSYVNMSTDISGILSCTGCNFINCSTATKDIVLTDGFGRFSIVSPKEIFFLGDNVTLTCAGSINVIQILWWNYPYEMECQENVKRKIFYAEKNQTQLSIQRILHIRNATECHRGTYICSGLTRDGNMENVSHNLHLNTPKKPYFTSTKFDKLKIILDPKSGPNKTRSLTCCADGFPRPNVTWFRNNVQLKESPEHHFIPESCDLIVVLDFLYKNGGRYTCKAQNRFGEIEDYVDFVIDENGTVDQKLLIVCLVFVFTAIGVAIAWLVLEKRRRKRARQKFKEAILERFEKGALDLAQLNVNIADQAEILPYDKRWEYPRKLLKFDKILGSGAFGIVRKAEAKSICPGKASSTVAVKMVRAMHKLHYMTALIRELKVLVHLGGHLNIVNLLGACTNNVSYGELLVIVEFCRFGNIRDYLFRHRSNFINQIDHGTEKIIGLNLRMDRIDIDNKSENDTSYDDDLESRKSCSSSDSARNDANDDDQALQNGLVQPRLRCNYRSDDPDLIAESICTKDLLCWAWQVTRGMGYLGLRKVVHGDLAARNILLADNNVIKICDFGLAEILFVDEDYRKSGEDPLPLQWMAPESIKDRVFSARSDIWSYGIVLWEFFSLSDTPYRGINPRHLYEKLSSGIRMSQPQYAPKDIYELMMKCWETNPAERPSFAKLERDIGKLLDDGIQTYYMDLTAPYTELSIESSETRKIDYLTMDPSQIKTVSFSTGQEEVQLREILPDEFRDSACTSTSQNNVSCKIFSPMET